MRKQLVVVSLVLAMCLAGTTTAAASTGSAHWGGHVKGRTEVTLDQGAAAALTSLGVRVVPLFASVRCVHGKTVYGFPIVGNPKDGTIEHLGGLLLYTRKASVSLTRFTIDLNRGVLSGKVNFGARADLFTIGAATPAGVTLSLTAGAAQALNATFGVSAFTAGLVIGYGNPKPRHR
jgi:hypothetical protein